ncbi:MAG: hypothetical protein OXL41_03715, partial [Nitrospinae bacterium]|nr:hypothetical protein [Nitrospinota bacterium]
VVVIESGKFKCHFVFSLMGMERSDSGDKNQATGATVPKNHQNPAGSHDGETRRCGWVFRFCKIVSLP